MSRQQVQVNFARRWLQAGIALLAVALAVAGALALGMPHAWAEGGASDADASSSASSGEQVSLTDEAGNLTVEGALANAQAAQERAAQSQAEGGTDEEQLTIEDDGHVGSTSVDDDSRNVVDPAQTADNSFIYDTSIASLADESSVYDGQTVQVSGEVVGDRIGAGVAGYYWVTVEAEATNDASSVSCYLSESLVSKIDSYGRYGVTGSRVQVRGEFHQACDEHDGLADIHVSTLEVTNPGYTHADTLEIGRFAPGLFLIVIGAAMVVAFRLIRERTR